MNTRLIFCFLLSAFCFPVCGGTFHVQWLFRDASSNVLSVKQVFIQPIAAYGVDASTVIISGDRLTKTSDSTGSLIVSNLFNGRSYRVQLIGPFIQTTFTNSFDTNVTGLVNGADPTYLAAPVRDTGVIAYSQAAADARFHQVAGDTSTNAAFRGTLKIPAGATVGYVFTVTNSDGSGAWQAATSAGSTSNFLAGQNTIWATVGGSNQVSITGTLTNNTTGNATTATTAAVATNIFALSPYNLLRTMAVTGPTKNTGNYNGASGRVTNSLNLVISPPGESGVLTELFIMGDVSGLGDLEHKISKVRLLIYSDTTNLTTDVPLSDLGSVRYRNPNDAWAVDRTSVLIDSYCTTTNYYAATSMFQYRLKIPMPYVNGMTAKLTNSTDGSTWSFGYLAAKYTPTTLPPALTGYLTYIKSYSASVTGTSNFLYSATGVGEIVGLGVSLSNNVTSDLWTFTDSNGLSFWMDSKYTWSGLDDAVIRTWGGAPGPVLGEDFGCTHYVVDDVDAADQPGWGEWYVWFPTAPITFTNGFHAYTDNGEMENASITTFYIRKP